MSDTVHAPWTPEQVAALNEFQENGRFHTFTCGSGRRTDADHLDGEGVLVATPQGWRCPYCDYTQDWCHAFMLTADSERIVKWDKEQTEYLRARLARGSEPL